MSERDLRDLKESVGALVKAMNNGGTVKLKPQAWWVAALAFFTGLLVSTVGYHITLRQDIQAIQNQMGSKMLDRWTGTMERECWAEFRIMNPAIPVPDVDAIRLRVPLAASK